MELMLVAVNGSTVSSLRWGNRMVRHRADTALTIKADTPS